MPASQENLVEQITALDEQIEYSRSVGKPVDALLAQKKNLVEKLNKTNVLLREGMLNG